ncbi:MAG: SMP-30/gluconolactonase/LRE family protein [Jhaorihella sp.]
MYSAPPSVVAEEFTRVPRELLVNDRPSPWSQALSGRHTVPFFLEGPSFDRQGNLWVVDIPWGRIFRIAPDGTFALVCTYEGEPNGLKFHADGRAFITDYRRGLMVLDPATGAIETLIDRAHLEGFRGLNDLHFSPEDGTLWFTDQGHSGLHDPYGRLFRLDPDGTLHLQLGGLPSPNGLVLDGAGNTLYVAMTRDNSVWRVPLRPNRGVGRVGRFVSLSGGIGPDGMAMDSAGNLAVCHPGVGSVWLFDPAGEPLLRIKSPTGRMTTNCAFGGAEGRHLYIVESETGSILRAECPAPGAPMFSHKQ